MGNHYRSVPKTYPQGHPPKSGRPSTHDAIPSYKRCTRTRTPMKMRLLPAPQYRKPTKPTTKNPYRAQQALYTSRMQSNASISDYQFKLTRPHISDFWHPLILEPVVPDRFLPISRYVGGQYS